MGVVYEVDVEVHPGAAAEFEAWLPGHRATLLALPGFRAAQTLRLPPSDDGWLRVRNQYQVDSREAADRYLSVHGPRIAADTTARFGEHLRFTRRVLDAPDTPRCLNCGAAVTARYCGSCGQRQQPLDLRLPHLLGEALEGVTHADSRLWRTLVPLIIRPGHLTREFLSGRRASYLPPFRLYLVVSLAFFLIAALVPDTLLKVNVGEDAEAARATSAAIGELDARIAAETRPEARAALERLRATAATAATAADARSGAGGAGASSRCALVSEGPGTAWLAPRLKAGCEKAFRESGALPAALAANLPRSLFVFLPVVAFVMLALYWRPRRRYVEHLLFLVHQHAAMFLVFAIAVPVLALVPGGAADVLTGTLAIYLGWYVYRGMRRMYGQGRARTLAKAATLGFVYAVLAGVMLVATILVSVATL
jgi:hypothetical protein